MESEVEAPSTTRAAPLACLFLALAVVAAFINGAHGDFVFDDRSGILENQSLHQPDWFLAAMHPPHASGITVDGRPILNLSIAINYLFSETRPEGYHLVNIAIHILASLVLYGIVRRLFARLDLPEPDVAAFAATLLWALHPLDCESVTYMIQRAESLMGLFYLLTVYCFLRSVEGRHGLMWRNLSVAACLFGVGTKEVAVSAPLIVLLYDRAFVSGTLGEAWRRRRFYYLGLFATWLVLGFLVVSTRSRGATSGPESTASFAGYIESQPMAILHYVGQVFWPTQLNFDWGLVGYADLPAAMRTFPWVALLVGLTLYGLWRNTAWGLAGFFFFSILAPTTFMPGTRQTVADHRMYLALIPFALGVTVLVWRWWGKRALVPLLLIALALGYGTTVRNEAFANETVLYEDSVQKDPNNHFAWAALGVQYMDADRLKEARYAFNRALKVNPNDPLPWDDLGAIEIKEGHVDRAIEDYRHTLTILPRLFQAHMNLANSLLMTGQPQAAMAEYEEALKSSPGDPLAENGLAVAYMRLGAPLEAVEHFKKSIQVSPKDPDTYSNLGNAFIKAGKPMDAIAAYQAALKLKPSSFEARYNLGTLLLEQHYAPQAVVEFQEALRYQPRSVPARENLGNAYMKLGRFAEAAAQYQMALQLDSNRAATHFNLGSALSQLGRTQEAMAECRKALELHPGMKPAKDLLARLSAEPAKP